MSIIIPNLRIKMAERGWGIKDVKERTSLSRTTISNMYNFYVDGLKFETLAELCDLFNCEPKDLIKLLKVEIQEYKITYETISKPDVSGKYDGETLIYFKSDILIDNIKLNNTFNITLSTSFQPEIDYVTGNLLFSGSDFLVSEDLPYSKVILDKLLADIESKISAILMKEIIPSKVEDIQEVIYSQDIKGYL
ncbi:helix-turn-helix transcriptional regulator [Mammaliicoccus sciuri]|uniref:helix-turn-helix domain-containing protein n=1 Tax=Mammaliicoccus sciuri TaxID=1296 RepID=UPI002DBFE377|nr:helix-turn-helix transcriptional regulator [Mammaliicoccus sciuri]MEB7404987.1 helix-turn-helix transcriptional regulator [Mammaliicoccus sciuri]MEB8312763.1 helix-turn-helix transcriptional regulator [Mammaliicoccus sciuri]